MRRLIVLLIATILATSAVALAEPKPKDSKPIPRLRPLSYPQTDVFKRGKAPPPNDAHHDKVSKAPTPKPKPATK